jgi:tetratricopeptide (TPR) repeat protein
LYLARRYDDAVQQARRTLELDPHDAPAYFWLARSYERLARPEQAIEAYLTPLTFSESNRERVTSLRAAAGEGGLKGFWRQRLQFLLAEPELRVRSIANAYVQIGEHDRAFEWLEKLYAERGAQIRSLKVNSDWDPLRRDPRFDALLRRTSIPSVPMSLLSRQRGRLTQ